MTQELCFQGGEGIYQVLEMYKTHRLGEGQPSSPGDEGPHAGINAAIPSTLRCLPAVFIKH